MTFSKPNFVPLVMSILIKLLGIVLFIPLHELAHGYTAYVLGDDTAKRAGRLTLNPLKHISIIGAVLLFYAGFGWAKPVPVNPRNFKNIKRDMAITAAAGPLMNFLLAVLLAFVFNKLRYILTVSTFNNYLLTFIYVGIQLNVGLGIFNLIPLPPLDGSKVLGGFLSDSAFARYTLNEEKGMIFLLIIFGLDYLFGINIFHYVIYPPIKLIMSILI